MRKNTICGKRGSLGGDLGDGGGGGGDWREESAGRGKAGRDDPGHKPAPDVHHDHLGTADDGLRYN